MKRKLNWTKVLVVVLSIISIISIFIDVKQSKQIKKLSEVIEKIDLPIEAKEGYWIEVSEIPQELLEKEVIIND